MNKTALGNFLAVVEIRTKLVSVSTLLLATCYVTWRESFPPLIPFILMCLATLAVDMGTTAFNNYFDYLKGTDRHRDIDESDKVLIHSGVAPGFAFFSALWCFAAAVGLGLAIALQGALWVVPVGAACMAVGFLYTGGPFPISRTPLGELFAGGCLGAGLFCIAATVWGLPFESAMLRAALPSFFWIASILTVNNTCDIVGDREAGRRTLSILLGARGGEIVVFLLGLAGQGSAIAAAFSGYLPLPLAYTMTAGTLPILMLLLSMHRGGYSHSTKGKNMQGILSCFLVFTVSMVCGFLLSGFLPF